MPPPTPPTPPVAKASAQQAAVGGQDPALSVGVGWPPPFFPSPIPRVLLSIPGAPYLLGKGKRGKIILAHLVPLKLLFKC